MKRLFIAILAISPLFLTGCAAVVDGVGYMKANEASKHPANRHLDLAINKNAAFTIAYQSMTAPQRKVTVSDRESGILQGQINDENVSIKVLPAAGDHSTIDLAVSYSQAMTFSTPDMEGEANALAQEIKTAAEKIQPTSTTASADKTTAPAESADPKRKKKHHHAHHRVHKTVDPAAPGA